MAYFLQLHSTVKIEKNSTGTLVVSHPGGTLTYSNSFSACIQKVLLLLEKGATETQLMETWGSDSHSLPYFFYTLNKLHQHNILSYTISHEDRPLARLHPFPGFSWDKEVVSQHKKLLSRFACLRRENESFFLESPLAHAKIEILDPIGFQILASLGKGVEMEDLTAENKEFIDLLEKGGFLEDEKPSLRLWEFHDLFFHSRSRQGRCGSPYGATFRFLSDMPPFPPIRPIGDQPLIPLKKALSDSDSPPFYEVLEKRRSLREYGEQPITLEQLGEFLFRSAAVRTVGKGKEYAPLLRTTPSGGACHPIEIYPLIAHCSGASPGLYRYEREQHALSLLAPLSKEMEKLLSSPNSMLQGGATVQILFIFTARFGRTLWKYERMAYAAILKDVGALMQTMYLVATAMGLAPCANGGGDSDLFEKVSGLDYFEEGAVGEFVLGSKKE